LAHGAVFIWDY